MQNNPNQTVSPERNQLSPEKLLFGVLVCFQSLCILALITIVQSPWYSQYFYERVAAQLLDSYRMTGSKGDPQLLDEAYRFGSKVGKTNHYPQLEAEEDQVYRSGATYESASAACNRLKRWTKIQPPNNPIRSIASQKLIRAELFLAHKALSEGKLSDALSRLDDVRHLLSINYDGTYGPTVRTVLRYLDIQSQLAEASHETQKARDFQKEKASLADPELAAAWYKQNNIPTFDTDYSPDYRIQWLMQNSIGSIEGTERIREAIAACSDTRVPDSTRLNVIQIAINTAIVTKDPALQNKAYQVWAQYYSQKPPNTKQEADLINGFLPTALKDHNPVLGCRLLHRLFEAWNRKLLKPSEPQKLIDETPLYYGSIHQLIPDPSCAQEMGATAELMERYCNDNRLDDTAASLIELCVLVARNDREHATTLADKMYQRPTTFSAKNEPVFALLTAKLEPPSGLTQEESEKYIRALRDTLAKGHWGANARLDILFRLTTKLRELPSKSDELEQVTKEVFELADSGAVTNLKLLHEMYQYRLSTLVRTFKFKEGGDLYEKIKKQFAKDPQTLKDICASETALWRAFPAYSPQGLAAAQAGEFPQQCFLDALELVRKIDGSQSEAYAKALLYLAEYEYCRNDKTNALKYCDEIINNWSPKQSSAVMPALAIKQELTNKETPVTKNMVVAHRDTKMELNCLRAINSSRADDQARVRVENLMTHVEER